MSKKLFNTKTGKKSSDVIAGHKNELLMKPIIEEFFNVKLFQTDAYHPFDFRDENKIFYEVKTRNVKHDKYPTTMVGQNKIEAANLSDRDVYFVFGFTDGNYYFKYNRNVDSGLSVSIGGRNDRGREEYKPYCWIPIEKLISMQPEEPEDEPLESESVIAYKEVAGDNQYKPLVESSEMCVDEEFGSV
jgi:hypothetical protein